MQNLWGGMYCGMYSFGMPLDLFGNKSDNTLLDIRGKITFKGRCSFGRGSKVIVDKQSSLVIGRNFNCTGRCNIETHKGLSFGDNCVLSWDITILDTDFHPIYNSSNEIQNHDKAINIGNNVWIGCKSTILKGVNIPNNVVVAAGMTLTNSTECENVIIGSSGANIRVLRKDIHRKAINI